MSALSTPEVPANPSHGRVEVLDLLRLFAVFAVLLFHYGFRGAVADGFTEVSLPGLSPVAKYGYFGVQLFFIISGFVIAYSAEGRTASAFAIARVSRIYPTFVLCMTVTFLLTLMIGAPRFEASITQWFANLLVVSPVLKQPFLDGAYWSIVYEITFYGWVFLLLLLGPVPRETVLIVVVWLAISIVNETILHSGALLRLFLTDQSAFFCIGLVLYEIFRGRRDRTIMLLLALCHRRRDHPGVHRRGLDARALPHRVQQPGDRRPLRRIGRPGRACHERAPSLPLPAGLVLAIGGLTYPLYLLHQHIGYMLLNKFAAVASAPVLVAATAAVVTAASFLIWRYFERPAQKRLQAGAEPRGRPMPASWRPAPRAHAAPRRSGSAASGPRAPPDPGLSRL